TCNRRCRKDLVGNLHYRKIDYNHSSLGSLTTRVRGYFIPLMMFFEIISLMISEVPSPRVLSLESRQCRCTSNSSAYPYPPCIWIASSQTLNPCSLAKTLAWAASDSNGFPCSFKYAAR